MYCPIHCLNQSPILELSVNSTSQICHENINKTLDGTYLADFGIDITSTMIANAYNAKKIKIVVRAFQIRVERT